MSADILLCSPHHGTGGIVRWTGNVMTYYQTSTQKTVSVEFMPMDRSSFVTEKTSLPMRIFGGFNDYRKFLASIREKISRQKYSAVHFTSSGSLGFIRDILLIRLLESRNIPSIVHFRFGRIPDLLEKRNWEYLLLHKVMKNVSQAIAIDCRTYNALKAHGYTNVSLVPNAMSPSMETEVSRYENEVRIPRRILFAGHLFKEKGIFELAHACSQIDDIELVIAGKGNVGVEDELRKAFSAGKNSKITFLGEISHNELIEQMCKCALFAFPSYTEGFPNAILEAMACGCTIIATPVGAIPEMLEFDSDKACGVSIPEKETEHLKDALIRLLDLPDLCREYGRRAKEKAHFYSIGNVWTQLEQVWYQTINK